MFALKIFNGTPDPGCDVLYQGLVKLSPVKILAASTSYGPKYSLSKKSIWVGPNSHVLLYG